MKMEVVYIVDVEDKTSTGNLGTECSGLRETCLTVGRTACCPHYSLCPRSRVYNVLLMCRKFLIYCRDPCACSDQLHFGVLCALAAGCQDCFQSYNGVF